MAESSNIIEEIEAEKFISFSTTRLNHYAKLLKNDVNACEQNIRALEQQLIEARQRLQLAIDEDKYFSEAARQSESDNFGYNELSRFEKSILAIKKKGRPLTINEIVHYLSDAYEPKLTSDSTNERDELSKFSASLKTKLELGDTIIKRAKNSRGQFVYGLSSMHFNGEQLKEEYVVEMGL